MAAAHWDIHDLVASLCRVAAPVTVLGEACSLLRAEKNREYGVA